MNEQLENMTVIMLRKAAKQMGVKLGMGISKQGIIDKLSAALEANPSLAYALNIQEEEAPAAPEPAAAPAAPPVRHASIIADDEPEEEEEDDVPVLTPNLTLASAGRAAPRQPAAPAAPTPASSLNAISSKAPAFTMEGSRAWHNPRAFSPQNNYPRPPANTWNMRSGQQPSMPGDARSYSRPAPQRMDPRNVPPPRASYVQRFGPEQNEPDPRADHRSAYGGAPAQNDYQPPVQRSDYRSDWQNPAPAYRGDYAPQQHSVPAGYYHKEAPAPASPNMADMLMAGDCGDGAGILEVHPDGYGFLRTDGYMPGRNDIYVASAQVRRFNLRTGDYIEGKTRPQRERDRSIEMLYITEINGLPADENAARPAFDSLTALYPKRRMELSAKSSDPALRILDLLSPIGFGQRVLLRAMPGAGKTTMIQKLAAAVVQNYPKAQVMVLLLDERPEEIPLMREAIRGDVIAASFGQPTDAQARLSEMALERAMRLVETKKDVVLFVDSLTKLARAYAAAAPQTARTLPNGIVAGSLNRPRRLFSAARNTREGGTLTVIAAVDADDPVADEMRNVCNMELTCSKALADRNCFPALDLAHCQTRRAELMLTADETAAQEKLRCTLQNKNPLEAVQTMLSLLAETENNQALVEKLLQSQPETSTQEDAEKVPEA